MLQKQLQRSGWQGRRCRPLQLPDPSQGLLLHQQQLLLLLLVVMLVQVQRT
jgi:hypothetical protein